MSEKEYKYSVVLSSDLLLLPVDVEVSKDEFYETLNRIRKNNKITITLKDCSDSLLSMNQTIYKVVKFGHEEIFAVISEYEVLDISK